MKEGVFGKAGEIDTKYDSVDQMKIVTYQKEDYSLGFILFGKTFQLVDLNKASVLVTHELKEKADGATYLGLICNQKTEERCFLGVLLQDKIKLFDLNFSTKEFNEFQSIDIALFNNVQ